MSLYSHRNILENIKKFLVFALVVIVSAGFLYSFFGAESFAEDKQREFTRKAIINAAVNCYAAEGFYPQSVDYLTEHYGVAVSSEKYVVNYTVMGFNTLPYVEVVPRGETDINR